MNIIAHLLRLMKNTMSINDFIRYRNFVQTKKETFNATKCITSFIWRKRQEIQSLYEGKISQYNEEYDSVYNWMRIPYFAFDVRIEDKPKSIERWVKITFKLQPDRYFAKSGKRIIYIDLDDWDSIVLLMIVFSLKFSIDKVQSDTWKTPSNQTIFNYFGKYYNKEYLKLI